MAHAERVNLVRATAMQTRLGMPIGGARLPDDLEIPAELMTEVDRAGFTSNGPGLRKSGSLLSRGSKKSWLKFLSGYKLLGLAGTPNRTSAHSKEVYDSLPRIRYLFSP